MIFDAIALGVALEFAYLARYKLGWTFTGETGVLDPLIPALCLAIAMGVFWTLDLYSMRLVGSGLDEYRAIVKNSTFAFAAIVVITYIDQQLRVSRVFLLLFWLITIVLVVAERFIARRVVRSWSRLRGGLRRVLVVGANNQAVQLARELAANRAACSTVLGFLSEYRPVGQQVGSLRILGEPTQLYEIAERLHATHVVIVQSALSWESLRFVVRSMSGGQRVEVLLAPGLFDVAATPLQFTQVGGASLLVPSASRIVGFEAVFKRALDLGVSIPSLLLTLPVQLGIWTYLKATGVHRPIETVEARGLGGTVLLIWRFAGGPRLQASHLSRLPSLLLVIRGQMSVVGPRPVVDRESGAYAGWSDVLAPLKPGFIGPWWVQGRGRPTGIQDEIEADLHYARSYTIWLDVRILFAVTWTLVTNWLRPPITRGAAGQSLNRAVVGASDED